MLVGTAVVTVLAGCGTADGTLRTESTGPSGARADRDTTPTFSTIRSPTTTPTAMPVPAPTATPVATRSSSCDPNYSGCVPIASDVDCAGGSGNGPAYVSGPLRVVGSDIYGLDRDHDGIACE